MSIGMEAQVGDERVQEEDLEALQVDSLMWTEGLSAQREGM